MYCLQCFLSRCVVLIVRLLLIRKCDSMIFIQVAAAAMVDIEVVFHAYSAADRAKIDDGMKRHGIGAFLPTLWHSSSSRFAAYADCGSTIQSCIVFTSLYLTRSAVGRLSLCLPLQQCMHSNLRLDYHLEAKEKPSPAHHSRRPCQPLRCCPRSHQ